MIKFKDILLREVEIGKPGQAPDITKTGTREQFVLALSRQIINAFKRKDKQYSDEFYLSGERSEDEDRQEVTLDVRFKIKPKQEYAYSISAYADSPLVKMVIEYNPKLFPKAFNALVAEVKETLEHEFEHVQQGAFYSQWIQSNRYDQPLAYPRESPQAPTHFLYLTSNAEVPAYVKGLIKKAKVNRITFDQSLEHYYNDYRDTFREEGTDWQKVKKVWVDWALTNKDKLKKLAMIKLKSLIPEAYTDEFGKNKWINLPHKAVEDYADTIADLVVNAYAGKGGNFEIRTSNDVRTSDLNFWVSNDVDSDVDMDVVVGGKTTPAGTKMTMIGQDGGATAKKVGVTKMIELMKTRGFYAEMDKDMAAKFGLPITKDEADIRKVINKDLKMNPDGSYDRQITGGPVKTKVLVGIPKV